MRPSVDVLYEHDPILVQGDGDFIVQHWSGSGTPSDPFVIDRLNITVPGTCIVIKHTRAHFVIRCCYLASPDGPSGKGIVLEDVRNARIEGNRVVNKSQGIVVKSSVGCTVREDYVGGYDSTGVWVFNSRDTVVERCVIEGPSRGTVITASSSVTVATNTIDTAGVSLLLSSSSACNLTGNVVFGGGLFVEGQAAQHYAHTVEGNTVNRRSLGYYVGLYGADIDTNPCGQLFIVQCGNSRFYGGCLDHVAIGVYVLDSWKCTVESIRSSSNANATALVMHSYDITLEGALANRSGTGFEVVSSVECTIAGSEALNCTGTGISVASSVDTRVVNTTALGCATGLKAVGANGTEVRNCTFRENRGSGISIEWSGGVLVTDSTTLGNAGHGTELKACEDIDVLNCTSSWNGGNGISLLYCARCTVNSTRVHDNDDNGIRMRCVTSTVLYDNDVMRNGGFGIYLGVSCTDNLVYGNRIGWNTVANAADYGADNSWDNGSLGNWWDDYTGSGTYAIGGAAGSNDRFPHQLVPPPPTDTLPVTIDPALVRAVSVVSALSVSLLIVIEGYARRHDRTRGPRHHPPGAKTGTTRPTTT